MTSSHPSTREPVAAYAAVNGTRLYYEVKGSGPALVLIHGYTLDTRMWDDQFEVFAAAYRVIRYDLRGFGKSAAPTGEPYAHQADLKALLDYLGLGRASLMGLSLGGAIAIDFALTYPEATAALVLVDVSALGGFRWPPELRRWFEAIEAAARGGDLALAKAHWLNTDWFGPARRDPALAARLEQIVGEYSGWHFVHDNPVQSPRPPANERLGEIRAPALIVVGELDLPFYNHPLADRLLAGLPHAEKVSVPGVGHMANMEAPAAFNALALGFLARAGAREEQGG